MRNNYTFDNFISGRASDFAVAACKEIVKASSNLNPIWIYGPSGCGKTHLLGAVYHHVKTYEDFKAVYISCDDLIRSMTDSLSGETALWTEILDCELLIVDDIDSLDGKPATQKEFFKLILKKCSKEQRVLFSSLCPPKQFKHLSDDVIMNIEMALFADMGFPDFEQRSKFVESYALKHEIKLSEDSINYIATNAVIIPQIKGYLHRLRFWAAEYGDDLSSRWVEHILERF